MGMKTYLKWVGFSLVFIPFTMINSLIWRNVNSEWHRPYYREVKRGQLLP